MNKYKLTGDLESGAYASFHIGKHIRKGDKYIFKIMKKKYYSLDECKNNKEVKQLQKFDHKNILKLVELINDDNELLMVFEYYTTNIKQVMKKRDKPFTEKETQKIMKQVLEAIDYLHKKEIMHRNLRPEALQCDDQATVVKLSDFSMALETEKPQSGSYMVDPVYYVAPEVMLGGAYWSPVDIWAAACIMAELMSGKPLLTGSSYAEQMWHAATLLGTFKKGEWPEGSMLQRQVGYCLPKGKPAAGLPAVMGVDVSGDAKDLIIDMMVWRPENRPTAEQCLQSFFFSEMDSSSPPMEKSQNNENGPLDTDALNTLKLWQLKWGRDLGASNPEALNELDAILTPRNPPQGGSDGYMGNSRRGSGMPLQSGGYPQTVSRGSALEGFGRNSLVQESYSRHEQRRTSRQAGQAGQSMGEAMLQDDQLKAQKNDFNQATQPQVESRKDRMKRLQYNKFKAIYGDDDSVGFMFSDKKALPDSSPGTDPQNNKYVEAQSNNNNNNNTNNNNNNNKGENKEMIRTRNSDFHSNNPTGSTQARQSWDDAKKLDLSQANGGYDRNESDGPRNGMEEPEGQSTRKRNGEFGTEVNDAEKKKKDAMIEKLKHDNPVKYRTKYRNEMSEIFGGAGQEETEGKSPRRKAGSQYKPSWADNNQRSTRNQRA